MKEKAKSRGWPFHFAFYQDFKIGVVIGYEDFISPVIVNHDSIKKVKFMEPIV